MPDPRSESISDGRDDAPRSGELPRLVRIGVLLFLCIATGMVCQFVLAWAVLVTSPTAQPRVLTLTAAEIAKPLDVPVLHNPDGSTSGPPIAEMHQKKGTGWLLDTEKCRVLTPAGRGCWGQRAIVKCGWPVYSLRTDWARIANDGSWPDWKPPKDTVHGYVRLDPAPTPPGVLVPLIPKTPIWQGVLVNTAVFGTIILAGVAMVRGIRRTLRRDRVAARVRDGLCERCGYPLNDLRTCPECGLGRRTATPLSPPSSENPPPPSRPGSA